MRVPDMLSVMSSRELSEWQAFEAHEGPIGRKHDSEMLMQIQELLQILIRVTVGTNEQGDSFEVRPPARPWWTRPERELSEEEQAEIEQAEIARFNALLEGG